MNVRAILIALSCFCRIKFSICLGIGIAISPSVIKLGGYMLRFAIFIYIVSLYFAHIAWSACSDLKIELEAMKKANQQLLKSLSENQIVLSNRIQSLTKGSEFKNGSLDMNQLHELQMQAESIKQRGLTSQKLATKLDSASNELHKKIIKCLK